MSTDWFRNTTWSESVEHAFEAKLHRASGKQQYLRIQACTLAPSHPEVALELLERYFEMPDSVDRAQAHVDRATALLALGRVNEAIASYESALAHEAAFPNLGTQAYLDLPYLVATRRVHELYDRAVRLLAAHETRPVFPVEHFRWHAARALIAADTEQHSIAAVHAEHALAAAAREHSGFRHHPSLGLVGEDYNSVVSKLEAYRVT